MTKPNRHLGNFRNPFGLIARMLRSGNRAAYFSLFREAAQLAAIPLDLALSPLERRKMQRKYASDLPLILILGAPRSGTTLAYQVLVRYFRVTYFSNLTSIFPRSPITATQLFGRVGRKPSRYFQSYYGQTSRLRGPSDGFHVWNQWLGEDRYVPKTDLSEETSAAMRHFFDVWTDVFGLPFVNKNNRNTVCLAALSRALDNARFLIVRRNQVSVAKSLIRSRREVQGSGNYGWGLLSRDADQERGELRHVDAVCEQLMDIERRLEGQIAQVEDSRIVEVSYEDFCADPLSNLRNIAERIPKLELNEELVAAELSPFTAANFDGLSKEEVNRIEACLGQAAAGCFRGRDRRPNHQ